LLQLISFSGFFIENIHFQKVQNILKKEKEKKRKRGKKKIPNSENFLKMDFLIFFNELLQFIN